MHIQGALSNVKGTVSTDEFVRFLAELAPQGHYFTADPPPGIVMTSALDWRVVVPDVATFPLLATALWSAYERFILPRRKEGEPAPAGIVVQMKNGKGAFDQFKVGGDILERDALVQRIEESARVLCPRSMTWDPRPEIEEALDSGYWAEFGG
ncbi:MAG: hypothetical protein HYS23_11525 [Geobacter sp.]|nr:hypothetical protein [Geobacter sp.]